jgi:hypothetical protein
MVNPYSGTTRWICRQRTLLAAKFGAWGGLVCTASHVQLKRLHSTYIYIRQKGQSPNTEYLRHYYLFCAVV